MRLLAVVSPVLSGNFLATRLVRGGRRVASAPQTDRKFSSSSSATSTKGLVLGVYDGPKKGERNSMEISGSPLFHLFDKKFGGALGRTLAKTGYFEGKIKRGKIRVFHELDQEYGTVVVVGLGDKSAGYDELEVWDAGRENVRTAAAAAAQALQGLNVSEADMDTFGDAEAAAEGSLLRLFSFDELKSKSKQKQPLRLTPLSPNGTPPPRTTPPRTTPPRTAPSAGWSCGVVLAEGQNYARALMETPSNLKFPRVLAERISADLSVFPSVSVKIRDEKWVEGKGMGAFSAVAKGSEEPLRLVEVKYSGVPHSDHIHTALVGKGITFDTGGISIKPSLNMDLMRGDMGGAACTAAAIMTAATLQLPINLLGIIPICENMPSGKATRPGDVVRALNGTTIQVDNTDAEGRLILADALCYAQEFKPETILDLATLTGAIRIALGSAAAGVYTNDNKMWDLINEASAHTGDRVWRMPLFKLYADQMTDCHLADVNNVGKYGQGGSCTAAGFLSEFIQKGTKWMHMDIAGVSENKDEVGHLGKGFTGRPTRTLVEFFRRLSRQ